MKSRENYDPYNDHPVEIVRMEDSWYDSLGEFHTYHDKIQPYEIDSVIASNLRRERKRFKSKKND